MKTIVTLCAIAAVTTAAPAAEPTRPTSPCDRVCLYRVLDDYLAARDAHDTRKVRWAKRVKSSENNVKTAPPTATPPSARSHVQPFRVFTPT